MLTAQLAFAWFFEWFEPYQNRKSKTSGFSMFPVLEESDFYLYSINKFLSISFQLLEVFFVGSQAPKVRRFLTYPNDQSLTDNAI